MDKVRDGSCRPRLHATTKGGAQPFLQSHSRQMVARQEANPIYSCRLENCSLCGLIRLFATARSGHI